MITVVVPCFNEEKTVRRVTRKILDCAAAENVELELILANDGSTDRTADLIAEIEKENPGVRSVHNSQNSGLGVTFLAGLKVCRGDRIIFLSGDDTLNAYSVRELFRNAYKADYVFAYMQNTEVRSPFRVFLSSLFTLIYATTFRLNVRNFQSAPVFSVAQLREIKPISTRYSFFTEVSIRLLRKGATYYEFPGYMNEQDQKSSAIRLKNLFEVMYVYLCLVWEIYFKSPRDYEKKPRRILPFN